MRTTWKHSLPPPSKQLTPLKQYSHLFSKHPPLSHKFPLQQNTQLLQSTHLSFTTFEIQKLCFEYLQWWKVKVQNLTLLPFITKVHYNKGDKMFRKMTFEWSIIQNSTQSNQSIVKHEAKVILNWNIWRLQVIERGGFLCPLVRSERDPTHMFRCKIPPFLGSNCKWISRRDTDGCKCPNTLRNFLECFTTFTQMPRKVQPKFSISHILHKSL